jgi:hypothetical protein
VDDPVQSQPDETSESRTVLSRRTLLKVGWTAPVIMTVAPAVAFAASGSTAGTVKTQSPGTTGTTGTTGTSGTSGTSGTTGTPSTGTRGTQSPGTTGTESPGAAALPVKNGATTSGIPEQQSGGPQPARINRGFTG